MSGPLKKYSPDQWTPEQAAKAKAAIEAPPADLSPENLDGLKQAYAQYEANQATSDPAAIEAEQASAPVPTYANPGNFPTKDKPEAPLLSSLASGLGRGATADNMDEGASVLMGGNVDAPGTPEREYAAGSRYKDNRNTLRAEQDELAEANPGITKLGMVAGGAPMALALPGAGKGAGLAAKLGVGALEGGALGAANGVGASEAETAGGVARDAMDTAGTGAVLGLAGTTAAHGAGELAPVVKKWLDAKADKNRVAGFGLYGAQMRDLADNIGEEGVSKLARDAEAKGLHKGQVFGFTGGVERGADNAAALRTSAGKQIGKTEEQILANPNTPEVPVKNATDQLRSGAADMSSRMDLDAPKDARYMVKQADRIAQGKKIDAQDGTQRLIERDFVPMGEAIENKRDVAGRIDWGKKTPAVTPVKDTTRKFVHKELLSGIEKTLQDAAERGELDPQLVKDYLQANKDFHLAATLEDPAQARVYREAGNQKVGLLDMIAANAGWAAGGAGHAVPAVIAAKLLKNRGAPALASTQRGLANLAGGIGNAASAAPGALGNLTAEQAAKLRAWLASQPDESK